MKQATQTTVEVKSIRKRLPLNGEQSLQKEKFGHAEAP